MKKINKLTKEQEKKFDEYIQNYLDMCTQPSNEEVANAAIKEIYKDMGQEEPLIIWGDSPIECCLFYTILQIHKELSKELDNKLHRKLSGQLYEELHRELRDKLHRELGGELDWELYEELHRELGNKLSKELDFKLDVELGKELDLKLNEELEKLDLKLGLKLNKELSKELDNKLHRKLSGQLSEKLYGELNKELRNKLRNKLDEKLGDKLNGKLYGKLSEELRSTYYVPVWWRTWSCYYQFAKKELNINFNEDTLNKFSNLVENTDCIFPFENIVFLSRKCKRWIINDKGELHNDNGPAIEYLDGWGVYSLHGTTVPKYLVETPESKLDIQFFLNENNADIKTEFVRKYGIERMSNLGTIVDSHTNYDEYWYAQSEYELIDMSSIFDSLEYAPYLKMKHQTMNMFCMEGVHPNCKTIKQALDFRNGVNMSEYEIKEIK